MLRETRNLPSKIPFFYGWVVVACAITVAVGRGAVGASALGLFMEPMQRDLGWSRTMISGALSVGALVGTPLAPLAGHLIDRYGARFVLSGSSLVVGACLVAVSFVTTPLGLYLPFAIGRAVFVGPIEVGITTAVSNWFVRRRPVAIALLNTFQFSGVATIYPMASAFIILAGWRDGWLYLGFFVWAIAVLPAALFLLRRPEDVGLAPDGDPRPTTSLASEGDKHTETPVEANFTLSQAARTSALWLIMGYTFTAFLFHGGISLHQIPHFIQRGLDPLIAASMASGLTISMGVSSFLWGTIARRFPLRVTVGLTSLCMVASALVMAQVSNVGTALLSVALFGIGLAGTFTLMPVLWADYYGRQNLGVIRGVSVTAQSGGAAVGPIVAGAIFDLTRAYDLAFLVLAATSLAGGVMAVSARRPSLPGVP